MHHITKVGESFGDFNVSAKGVDRVNCITQQASNDWTNDWSHSGFSSTSTSRAVTRTHNDSAKKYSIISKNEFSDFDVIGT